jgi:rhamnosyltransferase
VTSDFAVIVPTLNAGESWSQWLSALSSQTRQAKRLALVDSGSVDQTVAMASDAGFEITTIDKRQFDHGGTRQAMAEAIDDVPVLVFLTQDAVLSDSRSLERLVNAFADPRIAVAYGRQLPRPGAKPIEEHARLFNYPTASEERSAEDIPRLGIKAAFCSNSFAAYRRDALMSVGGFPKKQIMIEDSIVAARALLNDWRIAYVAEATVYHSHHYTTLQEFSRYFDIGVAHRRNRHLLQQFGTANNEGMRFARSELTHLMKHRPALLPVSLLRTPVKYLGYRLGLLEERLPHKLKRRLSMHKHFWNSQ